MADAASQPTPEMVEFYKRRTNEHIQRVRKCLHAIADGTEYAEELLKRAAEHDASKFGTAEQEPYIWLTEFHRCRQSGEPFAYPDGMEQRVRDAISHHVTTNRHHPDFHADPNDMTDVDLIEMVCDWTAMSEEFNQDGGSAQGYAEKTIRTRVHFNAERRAFIFQTIQRLDDRLRSQAAE